MRFILVSGVLFACAVPVTALIHRCYGSAVARRFGAAMIGTLVAQQALVALVLWRTNNRRGLGPIDLMTLSRGVGSALLVGLIGVRADDRRGVAGRLGWCSLVYGAIVCDWLDGPLARRLGTSEAGAIFDLEGDSWLTLCAAASAITWGRMQRFVVMPALLRYPLFFDTVRRTDYVQVTSGDPPWARRVGIAQMALFIAALAPFSGRVTHQLTRVAAPPITATQVAGLIILYRRRVRA